MKEINKIDKKLQLLTLLDKVFIEKNDEGTYAIHCKHYDEMNYKPLFVLIKSKDNKIIYGMDDLYDNTSMREAIDMAQLELLQNVVKQLLEE